MAIVTLETAATDTGKKDFVAVGTTIDRGEDLAVKGAVCLPLLVFDVDGISDIIHINCRRTSSRLQRSFLTRLYHNADGISFV